MNNLPQITTILSAEAVPEHWHFGSPAHGAEIQFRGVVRGTENGQPIAGIRYSAYAPMAERKLKDIAIAALDSFPEGWVFIQHRIGFVAAGEASLLMAVAMPHSRAAFDLSQELLKRLKAEVPIWKEIVGVEMDEAL